MKTILKFKTFAIALMLLIAHMPNGYADYQKLMAVVDEEFEKSDKQFTVITRPMNAEVVFEYLQTTHRQVVALKKESYPLATYEDILPSLDSLYSKSLFTINALALAIGHDDIERVRKFLEVVEDPTDPSLLSCLKDVLNKGKYLSVVNFVTDFHWHWDYVRCDHRLTIIDLLAEKNFNLNGVENSLSKDTLTQPPLFCGYRYDTTGTHCTYARLLLRGADPHNGTLHLRDYIREKNFKNLIDEAFKQVLNGQAKNIRPVPEVLELLKAIKQDYLKRLSVIDLNANFLPKDDKCEALLNTENMWEWEEPKEKEARLLLEGADFAILLQRRNWNSAEQMPSWKRDPLVNRAFQQILNGEVESICPVPAFLKLLEPKKEHLLMKINELPF